MDSSRGAGSKGEVENESCRTIGPSRCCRDSARNVGMLSSFWDCWSGGSPWAKRGVGVVAALVHWFVGDFSRRGRLSVVSGSEELSASQSSQFGSVRSLGGNRRRSPRVSAEGGRVDGELSIRGRR